MATDLEKFGQLVAAAARKGVAVERMWQQKLEDDLKRKETAQPQ